MPRFSLLLIAIGLIVIVPANYARAENASFYVTISDGGGTFFPGDAVAAGREGLIRGFQYHHARSRDFDPATGVSTSDASFAPLTFIKPIDQSTPLLQLSMTGGGIIPLVTLDFWRLDSSGSSAEVKYFTITLTDALIVDIRAWAPADPAETATAREAITMTFDTITWDFLDPPPQTSSQASWSP